jgi:hypothetical protein
VAKTAQIFCLSHFSLYIKFVSLSAFQHVAQPRDMLIYDLDAPADIAALNFTDQNVFTAYPIPAENGAFKLLPQLDIGQIQVRIVHGKKYL